MHVFVKTPWIRLQGVYSSPEYGIYPSPEYRSTVWVQQWRYPSFLGWGGYYSSHGARTQAEPPRGDRVEAFRRRQRAP